MELDPVKLVEEIKATAPSYQMDGDTYYVVELDRKVKESDLLSYAQEVIHAVDPDTPAPTTLERLVAATVDGRPMRWEIPVTLTWAIDESSFKGRSKELAKARKICAAATADWNAAAEEKGISDQISFEEDAKDPVFHFVFRDFGNAGLYAVAFFPNDEISKRVVDIGPLTFEEPNDFDPVGVLRHELGHVLGFRHEHIRPEAQKGMSKRDKSRMEQWVIGKVGGEALTDYDSQSVMHYPLNGRGTLDFQLSDADKAGFHKLYSADVSDVKEFPV